MKRNTFDLYHDQKIAHEDEYFKTHIFYLSIGPNEECLTVELFIFITNEQFSIAFVRSFFLCQ